MLGNHDGIEPISGADLGALKSPGLKAMAKLKALKTVPDRQKALERALQQIDGDDPHWPEVLASRLTEMGVEAADAHVVALVLAAEVDEDGTARVLRFANSQHGQDEFSQRVIRGLMSSSQSFGKRVSEGKVDSDEVFLRVAISHFFRRDPDSAFQMFMADAAARGIQKVWTGGVTGISRWALESGFDETVIPDDVTGFVLVMRATFGRAGYFLRPAVDQTKASIERMFTYIRENTEMQAEDELVNAAAATAFEQYFLRGKMAEFSSLMAAIGEKIGERYFVLYAREDDEGVTTQLIPFDASSPAEARRKALALPEVTINDSFRKISETLAQMADAEKERKTAS